MGRGSKVEQATAAKGLLYGPRRRGQGPLPEPASDRLRRLSWQQYIDKIVTIIEQVGLARADQADTDRQKGYPLSPISGSGALHAVEVASGEGAAVLFARQVEGDQGRRGVVLGYREAEDRIDDQQYSGDLSPGEREVNSLAELEDLVRQPLVEAGFDYLELRLSGKEILDRFDEGEKIAYTTSFLESHHNRQIMDKAMIHSIKQSYSEGLLGGDQANHLLMLIATSDQEILSTLARDPLGRDYLRKRSDMPVRIELQDGVSRQTAA